METVCLRTFDNYFTANIWLARLREAGIDCHLLNENTVTIIPYLSNSAGGIQLIAPIEQEKEALRLIREFDAEASQGGLPADWASES